MAKRKAKAKTKAVEEAPANKAVQPKEKDEPITETKGADVVVEKHIDFNKLMKDK